MKVLKRLNRWLSRECKSIFSELFLIHSIADFTLYDWDRIHEGNNTYFLKPKFRYNILLRLFKGLDTRLDYFYGDIFRKYGTPQSYEDRALSLQRELELRCDAIIYNDASIELLADIEKTSREDKEKGFIPKSFQSVLVDINLNSGTNFKMKDTTLEEYYELIKSLNSRKDA